MKRFLSVFAIAALSAASAQAQTTLLNDNFSTENGGNTALNYASFANWNVTGKVDLVAMPNSFGITCAGSCVDLDGSSNMAGKLTSKIAYSFSAGDVMKISFDLRGSQRGTNSDDFTFGMVFGAATDIASCTNVLLDCVTGSSIPTFSYGTTINSTVPFSTRSLEFTAGSDGTVQYSFGTTSHDNIGPLLDNVLITRTSVVPEPSTWALMVAGLGALGVAAKRRRA